MKTFIYAYCYCPDSDVLLVVIVVAPNLQKAFLPEGDPALGKSAFIQLKYVIVATQIGIVPKA